MIDDLLYSLIRIPAHETIDGKSYIIVEAPLIHSNMIGDMCFRKNGIFYGLGRKADRNWVGPNNLAWNGFLFSEIDE